MLSRVAENIYWMARYVERAENTARLVQVHGNLLLDLPRGTRLGWEALLQFLGCEESFFRHYKIADERNVVKFLLADRDNPSSIVSALAAARENIRTTRDVIPGDAFEHINNLDLFARNGVSRGMARRARYGFLNQIILGSQLNGGLLASSMCHDETYDFVELGRYLERADMTTRILDVRSANVLLETSEDLTPFENIQWMSVLKSLSAYQMYRRHVRASVRDLDVLRFAIQDRLFPRAVMHCVERAEAALLTLPRNSGSLEAVAELKARLSKADILEIREEQRLHQFMDELQIGLMVVHNRICDTYFELAEDLHVAVA